MSRRRKSKRNKGALKAKLFIFLVFTGIIGWVGVTAFRAYEKVEPMPASTGHDFISQESSSPTLLLVKQSATTSYLDELYVVKIDTVNRSISAIQLPPTLSDGQTTLGQYMESRYYKELQIGIEQQLAIPIQGYIVQTRANNQSGQFSLIDAFVAKSAPNWWTTTIGLPLWLDKLNKTYTNIPHQELISLLWLVRDIGGAEDIVVETPAAAQQQDKGHTTLLPEKIDPIIQQQFIAENIRSEEVSVVVKNATDVSGLASVASRFVANMGGEIVAVEVADTPHNNSSIISDRNTALSDSVSQFFGVPITIQSKSGRERADIELVIGNDALVRLGK